MEAQHLNVVVTRIKNLMGGSLKPRTGEKKDDAKKDMPQEGPNTNWTDEEDSGRAGLPSDPGFYLPGTTTGKGGIALAHD